MSFEIRQFQRSDPLVKPPGTATTGSTTETSQNTGLGVSPLPTAVSATYASLDGTFQSSNVWQGSGSGEDIASTTISPTNTEESETARTVTTSIGQTPGLQSGAPVAVSSSSKGSNLSNGAVAGVAIGALIVGAALAFLAAFFLFKRRNNNKSHNDPVSYKDYSDSSPELVMMQKSAGRNSPYVQVSQTPMPALIPAPPPAKSPDIIASILPTAAHESEIKGRITALFSQIHRHIEAFYRDVHASITPSMEPELAKFGAKDVNMAEMLQDASSPTTALKHALAAYVLGITSPKSADNNANVNVETLFPAVLGSSTKSHHHDHETDHNPTITTALSLHRRLSVFLYTSSPHSQHSSLSSSIREAAEHFSLTFFPWANPGSDDQEKEDDLTRVISEALDCRIWLYGQPGEYEYRWDGVGTRGVVVGPEVLRRDEGEEKGRVVVVEGSVVGL